jgi:peptidyl-prolyl cis-trans isomerase SurA
VDADKLATAKAKADDIEAKLKAGGDFDQIARSSSDGQTAAEGGDLGKYGRGSLAKVLEDSVFSLKAGQFTEPIRTKQGYIIFKVVEHVQGGVPQFKDVRDQVEETYYMSRMEPAIRDYLTTLREDSYIDIRPGYVDTGASPRQTKPVYSAYTPPAAKKKKKVQRTRFRETEHGFRKKEAPAAVVAVSEPVAASKAAKGKGKSASAAAPATMKAGKKEKIRYGQAPRETLPNAAETRVEDAGALPKTAENAAEEPVNPLEAPAPPVKKSRFAARAKLPKAAKPKGPQLDSFAPAAPDSSEVSDQQTQSAPLGLGGDTASKKKKKANSATVTEKKRMKDRQKNPEDKKPLEMTPAPAVPGAPAPKPAGDSTQPAPAPTPAPSPAPQQ